MVETYRPTADYSYLIRDEKLVLQRLWEPIEPREFYADPSASDEENDMLHEAWIKSMLKPEWRDVPVRVE